MHRPKSPEIAQALGGVHRVLDRLPHGGRGAALLVACSGGPDSLCALGLLHLAAPARELRLAVGHIDHGLRGAEASKHEAQLVRERAAQLSPDLRVCVQALRLEPGPGLPDRARRARHRALAEQAAEVGADYIALGHTATDQVETMLMHLVRGAGLDGLAAMAHYEHPRIRPVLDLTRAQTQALCPQLFAGHTHTYVDDPSNHREEHFRIELRHEVLPRLRQQNPALERSFGAAARELRDADAAIEAWVQRELAARRRVEARGAERTSSPRYDLAQFHQLPRAVRTRLLRRVFVAAGAPPSQLGRRSVDDIDRAIVGDLRAGRGPSPRRWDLPGGGLAHVAKGAVWAEFEPNAGASHL